MQHRRPLEPSQPPLRPPQGLRKAGRALWDGLTEVYDFDQAELVILRELARTADRLERCARAAGCDPVGPAVTEARQQAIVYARLHAALRLPDVGDGLKRPQRRAGVRGAYGLVG